MSFNPQEYIIPIKKGKNGEASDYLPVQARLIWFREQYPEGTIESELVHLDLDREISSETFVWNGDARTYEKEVKTACGIAVFKATVADGQGGSASAYGSETAVDFSDFIEKSNTKAVGRALAMLGFGTQFVGDELDEQSRLVDTPADGRQVSARINATSNSNAANGTAASIGKSSPSPSSANTNRPQPTVKALRARAKQLFPSYSWEAVLEKILGTIKPDDNLVTEELLKIERNLDGVEARRANGAA